MALQRSGKGGESGLVWVWFVWVWFVSLGLVVFLALLGLFFHFLVLLGWFVCLSGLVGLLVVRRVRL